MRLPTLPILLLVIRAAASAAPPRLHVSPPHIALWGPLGHSGVLATVVMPDGSRRDVSGGVVLSSASPRTAGIEGRTITARGNGRTFVAVRYHSLKALVPVDVSGADRPIVYSFTNDVIPTLAHIGCSAGTCHGASSGKGGFKLSLRGYAPEIDYLTLTRQYRGRRICRADPENSLMVRKPTMRVSHGGGRVLVAGTPEYRTLLGWIREGAPGPDEKEPRLVGLDAYPGNRVYRPNERQHLLIRARFTDGHTQDVTSRAIYRSNDLGTARVSDRGEITAGAPGATAIQAKYGDRLAVVQVVVPFAQKIARPFPAPANEVDEAVYASLRLLHLEPSGLCTDSEFVRRVYLDALGTLPTAEEARAFLANREPDRRARLIDAVLQRPEYGDIWALKLADLFLMRREHMERKNTIALQEWIASEFRADRPWDQLATEILTADGSTVDRPETLWYISRQSSRPNAHGWIRNPELTGEIASQVFLGTRIQCAKCHNHPTERYTQDDYYHFASIFAKVNGDGPGDPVPARILAKDDYVEQQPRTGEPMPARPLDRSDLRYGPKDDPRLSFARWLTAGGGREAFARAIVNRVWARLFGSGIVEPVDDMRSTNPPKNEPLMARLAGDLIAHRFDLKYLMGTIMRSRTYQATSASTPLNRLDTQFFSHYPARRIQAEEMLDAVAQVTGVPDRFATYPVGTRAIELTDPELVSPALDTFGRPVRIMPTDSERCTVSSMSQALALFNGEELQRKLKSPEGTVSLLLKKEKENPPVIRELFLSALAREPSEVELAACTRAVDRAPSRPEGVQDVLWALINSKEFIFNH